MDRLFYGSLFIIGFISISLALLPERKLRKCFKISLLFIVVLCLGFQGWYGFKEKRIADYKDLKDELYKDETLRRDAEILRNINELKEKEKKGILTDNDYSLYIVRYLESIDHTLKYADGKNTREWITTYYDAVNKIPDYFTPQEWKESEKLIYESMMGEITSYFSMRGTLKSGISAKLFETFKRERNRLLKAKEREFNK